MRRVTMLGVMLGLMPAWAVPARADLLDLLAGSLWAEACAVPGTREADRWVALSRDRWCEEFVGDFGRVHGNCLPVFWQPAGVNRLRAVFHEGGTEWILELVTPNLLSVFSRDGAGDSRQEMVLGRARANPEVATLHVQCR